MDKYFYYSANPLKINKKQINKEMKKYMSDSDITKYLGKKFENKIIKYSDIKKYNTISDLLPNRKNGLCKIILIEDSYNSGHWISVLRIGKTIEYFNSYGAFPSVELDGNSYLKNAQLDQDVKYLNILLNKAYDDGYNVIYNKTKFQKLDDNIATCGRWNVLRCLMFDKYKMDLFQFINFIDDLKKKFDLTSDQLVTLLVSN